MVRRLLHGGHSCVVFDSQPASVTSLAQQGATGSNSIDELIKKLGTPRVLWLMVPAGAVDTTLHELSRHLQSGDIVVDGGNFSSTISGVPRHSPPLDQIPGDWPLMMAIRREPKATGSPGPQALGAHQAHHAIAAHAKSTRPQGVEHARTPIPAPALGVHETDSLAQPVVHLRARGHRARSPRVLPARRDVERAAQNPNRIAGLLRVNEPEGHSVCFAKKAVAFFKMSRSCRNWCTSRRSAASSVRSSVVSRSAGAGRAALIHRCSVIALTPRSRATCRMGWSDCCSRRSASALNSGVYRIRFCTAWRYGRLVCRSADRLCSRLMRRTNVMSHQPGRGCHCSVSSFNASSMMAVPAKLGAVTLRKGAHQHATGADRPRTDGRQHGAPPSPRRAPDVAFDSQRASVTLLAQQGATGSNSIRRADQEARHPAGGVVDGPRSRR